MAGDDALSSVRIDRWLWAARLFKTRSRAAKACAAGHVKRNGESVKSSKPVRAGDRLEVLTPGGPRIVDVIALLERRVGAAIAETLYTDLTPPSPPREPAEAVPARRARGAGRPSKRERRQIDRFRRD